MIGLPQLYLVAGLFFATFALLSLRDASNLKRFGNAGFWGLLATSFLAGDRLGDFGNGLLALTLVALGGFNLLGRGTAQSTTLEQRTADSARFGNLLFGLALIIPAVALAGTLLLKYAPDIFDPKQATLISLIAGVLAALAVGYAWLKPRPLVPFEEGRRLLDSVGWAAILPQLLASLGAVFALAGVGEVVGTLIRQAMPQGNLAAAVIAFGLGMALFTVVMGNAFAAFPVMATAIAIPVLIRGFGGDPAIVCAIGMLCGFCGTLLTPMAANFNIVPAALLGLKDRNGVIKQQVGTALPLLAVNIALIYWLAFR